MLLGTKNITQNDVRRYKVNYSDYLQDGNVLEGSPTVSVVAFNGLAASIGTGTNGAPGPVLTPDAKGFYYWVIAGDVLQSFTVQITVTDSFSETINDTCDFNVVEP